MNTEPEWPETNAMGTIGWRREPITAAAIQASALASKARLCPTCQTCNPTCRSLQPHLQPHLPEPLHPYAAERAHPMSICYCVRCWVPSGQSRPNPSPNPNPNQVLYVGALAYSSAVCAVLWGLFAFASGGVGHESLHAGTQGVDRLG